MIIPEEEDVSDNVADKDSHTAHMKTITFRVLDTGPGMSPSFQARICQPFSQENSLTGGTGLGLAITRYLVQAMNGEFTVTSELHKGSTFQVKIPVRQLSLADRNTEYERATSRESAVFEKLRNARIAVFSPANEDMSVDDVLATMGAKELAHFFRQKTDFDIIINPHLSGQWEPEHEESYSIYVVHEDPIWLRRVLRIPGAKVAGIAGIASYDDLAQVREEAILQRQLTKRFGSAGLSLSRSISQDGGSTRNPVDLSMSTMNRQITGPPARCVLIAKPIGPIRIFDALASLFGLKPISDTLAKDAIDTEDEQVALSTIQEAERVSMMRLMLQTREAETQTDSHHSNGYHHGHYKQTSPTKFTHANGLHDSHSSGSDSGRSGHTSTAFRMPKIKQKVTTAPDHQVTIETTISFDESMENSESVEPVALDVPVVTTAQVVMPPSARDTQGCARETTFSPPTATVSGFPEMATNGSEPSQHPTLNTTMGMSSTAMATVPPTPSMPPVKVLIVEDNRVNAGILEAYLKRKKCTYMMAENGLAAVRCVQEHGPFDIILMDIQMPVMDGNEATIKIRQMEAARGHSGCYIWALTGLASVDDEALIRRSGANAILTKPVSMKKLGSMIDKVSQERC